MTCGAGDPGNAAVGLGRVLLEKLDVLLDRITDRALASPRAGSAASR